MWQQRSYKPLFMMLWGYIKAHLTHQHLKSLIQFPHRLSHRFLDLLSSVIQCDSDFGFLNYVTNACLISLIIAFRLLSEYFIYHVSTISHNDVMSCAFFKSSLLISIVVHTASTKDQNWSGSSHPNPLMTGNLMSSTIILLLDRLGGGDDGGGGGCGGGGEV